MASWPAQIWEIKANFKCWWLEREFREIIDTKTQDMARRLLQEMNEQGGMLNELRETMET